MRLLATWGSVAAGLCVIALAACARPEVAPAPWYAGDTHIHGHGCGGDRSPRQLIDLMAGAGLSVGSALIWGQGYDEDVEHFTGADSPASTPERVLRYDLEVSAFPSDATGHLIALGLRDIGFPHRPTSLPIAEWAIGQGALVGMAHAQEWTADYVFPPPGSNAPYEFPIDLALGKVHFLETEALEADRDTPAPGFQFLWATLLNSGFKVPIVGASDFPCMAFPSLDRESLRTYVRVEGPLSYEGWLEGIRSGRTVVAQGARDFLTLTVNGAMIGSDVGLAEAGSVEVEVEAHLRGAGMVSLVVNGEIAASAEVSGGPGQRFKRTLQVSDSSWIAARAPRVQTGAIYIIVGERPIRVSTRDARYYVEYVDHLLSVINDGGLIPAIEGAEERRSEMEEIQRSYTQAREVFEQRWSEAGAR